MAGVEIVGDGLNQSHVCYNDMEGGLNGWCATCDHKNTNTVNFLYLFTLTFFFSIPRKYQEA
jgi:7-cyano-7-deazaguanine synthase in queuosine biosynthesis